MTNLAETSSLDQRSGLELDKFEERWDWVVKISAQTQIIRIGVDLVA